jgi:hypothetical protein
VLVHSVFLGFGENGIEDRRTAFGMRTERCFNKETLILSLRYRFAILQGDNTDYLMLIMIYFSPNLTRCCVFAYILLRKKAQKNVDLRCL